MLASHNNVWFASQLFFWVGYFLNDSLVNQSSQAKSQFIQIVSEQLQVLNRKISMLQMSSIMKQILFSCIVALQKKTVSLFISSQLNLDWVQVNNTVNAAKFINYETTKKAPLQKTIMSLSSSIQLFCSHPSFSAVKSITFLNMSR